ncbi:MAG: hypothetical protein U9O56_04960 [Campylobacterota bacterium]|nr:hypothetical protein [Campylobacterota bacterium]
MDIVIIIALILIVGIVFLLFQNKPQISTKSKALKKAEIIKNYETQLKTILEKHKDNKTKQIELKKQFLQKCSSEFSRNIFFSELEAKQIIQKLASL